MNDPTLTMYIDEFLFHNYTFLTHTRFNCYFIRQTTYGNIDWNCRETWSKNCMNRFATKMCSSQKSSKWSIHWAIFHIEFTFDLNWSWQWFLLCNPFSLGYCIKMSLFWIDSFSSAHFINHFWFFFQFASLFIVT